ncbi:bifunctional phosphoribosylaminoimidazolecarboxamide formyltransferase/IMP cyclohydrolase [Isachenkonia alkalipeptolytica]|uniref:Bifunctional purine biosynthesis protein PurH n=1 Tax=Isachenkonia alkalipeptolytica TaxID=2565777 RepID=A0AA43XJR6_9CLOT|nr:bifunctional phosphoribosylaminoimidazolecarboxamide formyltransferase/IMP cyclohydrolase [Isachenkonia alkalipeptolytica]NBG87474.1 bifunctional phosphoribosylaminoimidazolecarboxamide formyltransferase/IMP cyclohydrolase [Isachenkonia alkalipeptolytica]
MKRALISVSDKDGILDFARGLSKEGIEILSTGGTAKLLREGGLTVKDVSEVTGFPECLDGRVKTLHPKVHGGILAKRGDEDHQKTLKDLEIDAIDLVVINLYPFKETIAKEAVSLEEAIENIDIGGPTMLRSAAKNFEDVTVVTDRRDYDRVLKEIQKRGDTSLVTRYELALKVFRETAYYDGLIAEHLGKNMKKHLEEHIGKGNTEKGMAAGETDQGDEADSTHKADKAYPEDFAFPEKLTLPYEKVMDLRYGENPHQKAAFYREAGNVPGSLVHAEQLQGKALSFNNLNDTQGALELLKEFEKPTAVAVKHTNPCGVASNETIEKAFEKCYAADPKSIFGGIVALNREVDESTAREMEEIFLEVVVAPGFSREALEVFKTKKNLRILQLPDILQRERGMDIKKVSGGLLVQDKDRDLISDSKIVTEKAPGDEEMKDLEFAYKVAKHVKSNGVVIAKDQQTLAIGPGQTSRIWALDNAIRNVEHDLAGSVLASDAFFPFDDCVMKAKEQGISAIIQPGGSLKDEDSIQCCDRYGISMVFTGMRHFKH